MSLRAQQTAALDHQLELDRHEGLTDDGHCTALRSLQKRDPRVAIRGRKRLSCQSKGGQGKRTRYKICRIGTESGIPHPSLMPSQRSLELVTESCGIPNLDRVVCRTSGK